MLVLSHIHTRFQYRYQIGDAPQTFVLDGASNGLEECGFTISLTEKESGLDIDPLNAAFTLNDAEFIIPDSYRPNHRTLTKHAEVILQTNELSLEGEYDLTLAVHDLWGATDNDPSADIKIWVHRANLC